MLSLLFFFFCLSLQGVEVVRDRHQAAVRLYNMVKRETAGTVVDVCALARVRLIEVSLPDSMHTVCYRGSG